MTLDKFRKDFMNFLKNSNINLGRKQAKTRKDFLLKAENKFKAFINDQKISVNEPDDTQEYKKNSNIIMIKPNNPTAGLSVGKGVHAMTSSESMRADEQLNRSPYSQTKTNKE